MCPTKSTGCGPWQPEKAETSTQGMDEGINHKGTETKTHQGVILKQVEHLETRRLEMLECL